MFDNFRSTPEPALPARAPEPEAGTTPPASPGAARFYTCRWHKKGDDVSPHCTHRDVLPMAGTTDFNMDAWCTDCGYYKLRRTPRKPPYA